MNKPTQPAPPFESASPPYEFDGYGWAMAQAELIRARRFESVDWDNVAEEVESVGKTEQSHAESALRVLMTHILKWRHQPKRRSRSWALSILEQRLRYERRMAQNPGLQAKREEMRDDAYRLARIAAAKETDLPLRTFPEAPLDWDEVLKAPFEHEID